LKQAVFKFFSPKSVGMVRRSRGIPLPEPASLTNSLKICERCRLGILPVGTRGRRRENRLLLGPRGEVK
jgi:hypothetical protein